MGAETFVAVVRAVAGRGDVASVSRGAVTGVSSFSSVGTKDGTGGLRETEDGFIDTNLTW